MVEKLEDLNHTYVRLSQGGEVFVMDDGAVINAEAMAMLQALHSRSTGGIRSHLEILAAKGAENFMRNFYVGYGHKSIGDCGTGTLFVEGVSMLAAKAIQDSPLYAGQEASTRYIDFSKQPFIDPTRSNEGRELLELQRAFYIAAQEPTKEQLKKQYPRKDEEKEKSYDGAIAARAFDITRGLLPAGASTNLAWHTSLRHAADRLLFLRHHPLSEVADAAIGIEKAVQTHYPNSFGHKRYPETEAFQDIIADQYFYHDKNSSRDILVDFSGIRQEDLDSFRKILNQRPPKAEIPKFVGQAGTMDVRFVMDYGSFRDIQRHRAITQRMPLLTSDLGFNEWYRENLPESVRERLDEHLGSVQDKIDSLGISKEEAQYFNPMGFNVSNRFSGDIPGTVYMVELRDSRFVHPTLQRVAHDLGIQIRNGLGIPIHVDSEPNRFDVRRGDQTIRLKDD